MSTDKEHAAFYKALGPKEAKAKAWFKREEAKLVEAEKKLADRRIALAQAYRDKLYAAETEAFTAMRRVGWSGS